MSFAKYDQVIQTLSADRAYDSFSVRILPGGPWCSRDLFNAHSVNPISKGFPVDSIAVSDKRSRRLVEREGVDYLLSSPFSTGIRGNIEMNHLSLVMTENNENVQHAKCRGRQGKEVAGGNVRHAIVQ